MGATALSQAAFSSTQSPLGEPAAASSLTEAVAYLAGSPQIMTPTQELLRMPPRK